MELGREGESLEEMRIAAELDPLSAALASNMAYDCSLNGEMEESEKWLLKVNELDTSKRFVGFIQALLAEYKEDFEVAALHAEEALRRHPSNNGFASMLGFYYARLGRREKAQEILQKLTRLPDGTSGKPFNLAILHAGLGNKDEMFRQLDLAFDEHSILFRALRHARFDPSIREDGRYAAIFQRANLRP